MSRITAIERPAGYEYVVEVYVVWDGEPIRLDQDQCLMIAGALTTLSLAKFDTVNTRCINPLPP
jgi:hypothetical protein